MSKDNKNTQVLTIYVNDRAFIQESDLDKAVGFALSLHKTANCSHVIKVEDVNEATLIYLYK